MIINMIKNLFRSQLRINIISGAAVTVINTVAFMVAYPVYLHFLGYERYGLWLVLSAVLSFSRLSDLGICQALTKIVAQHYGSRNLEAVRSCIATSIALLSVIGVIILTVILILKHQIIGIFGLTGHNAEIAALLMPWIGFLSLYVFIARAFNAVISGLGRMDLANYILSAGRITGMVVSIILLALGWNIKALLAGGIISQFIIHILSLSIIRKTIHTRIMSIKNIRSEHLKEILVFGGNLSASSILRMLLNPFSKLMLSRYAGVASIPVYEIAHRGAKQIKVLAETGLRSLMPEISRIISETNENAVKKIRSIVRKANWLVAAAGVPVFAGLFLLADILLKIWLGRNYNIEVTDTFRIILVGTFFSMICIPSYYTLLGIGRSVYSLFSGIIECLVNVSIIMVMIYTTNQFTAKSAAIASMSAMIAASLYIQIESYRILYKSNGEKNVSNL